MDTNLKAATPEPGSTIAEQLERYRAGLEGFDEMIDADGKVRRHWQAVVSFLEREEAAGCNSRSERIQRRIVENGLTLDSFADPDHVDLVFSQQN